MRTSNLLLFTGLSALLLTFAACGDDDEAPAPTSTGTTTTSSAGGSTTSAGGAGGSGGDTTSTGGTGGTGVGGAGGGVGGSGGGEQAIHGCTLATAEDLTAETDVTITDGNAWTSNPAHNRCIRVAAGTTVTWESAAASTFSDHPLQGGIAPNTPDATSPITLAATVPNNTGGTEVSVTFNAAGAFPYYCSIHTNMNGVVYVE